MARTPGALPPELRCTRAETDEVVLEYASERRMCALAKGIAKGIAGHYGERIAIDEDTCMLDGSDRRRIRIRRVSPRAGSIEQTST